MRETVNVTGMVIRSSSFSEADRRLVVLSRERGKITVFARGAKRPGSPLMASSRTFAFGVFKLTEGREAYNLQGAEISRYFEEIAQDMETACYGSYFLELADYYGKENLDGTELLKLIYQSLRALMHPSIPNLLVRRIFELKSMVIYGEYTEHPSCPVSDSANYAWEYVCLSPVESLYQFTLKPEVLQEFSQCVEDNIHRYIEKHFSSLDILDGWKKSVENESKNGYDRR